MSNFAFLSEFEGPASPSAFRLADVKVSDAFFFLLIVEVKSFITGADVDVVIDESVFSSLSRACAAMAGALRPSASFGVVFSSSTCKIGTSEQFGNER